MVVLLSMLLCSHSLNVRAKKATKPGKFILSLLLGIHMHAGAIIVKWLRDNREEV